MKLLLLFIMFFSQLIYAETMQYPELNVTPRAKQRIRLEIRNEAGSAWSSHLSIQLSSLTTLVAGAMSTGALKDNSSGGASLAPTIAMAVGGTWLAATAWASMSYRPYRKFYNTVKRMPYKSKRQKLTVERLAEEELSALRAVGWRIRWFSVFTNLGASAFLAQSVKSNTNAQIATSFSALMSFAPLFFKYHWEDVANEQEKYKKKIFSPVAMAPIFRNPFTQDEASGVSFLFRF